MTGVESRTALPTEPQPLQQIFYFHHFQAAVQFFQLFETGFDLSV